MSRIAYDPIKDRFAKIIRNSKLLRTLFYKLLDVFFLRSWYVRNLLRKHAADLDKKGHWKLLDAGSGFGQYDRFILNEFRNVEVTSVDVKKDYLADSAKYFEKEIQKGRISFSFSDLLAPNIDEHFDFIICIDVLEHIEEDIKVMENLENVLNPGGLFLMHSPSIYSEEDAGEDDSFVDEHARVGYSKKEITSKLQQAGLQPVDVQYTYGKKGHLAWKLLIKYPMLWMTRFKLLALPLMAVYYLFTLPVGLILMKLDLSDKNIKGTGIFALARK
ncbi:MAG: class I SAM-dependent methyltransferase [Balneolaceae bacterium]|nr:class I SAM-dependent methyltransferase [Balneolaceae bacterium]